MSDRPTTSSPGNQLLLRLHLPSQLTRDERRPCLLIEPRGDVVDVGALRPPPSGGGDQPRLPVWRRRHRHELQEKLLLLLRGAPSQRSNRRSGVRHLEVHRQRRVVVQRAQLPRRGPSTPDGDVGDCPGSVFLSNAAHGPTHPAVFTSLDVITSNTPPVLTERVLSSFANILEKDVLNTVFARIRRGPPSRPSSRRTFISARPT